MACAALFLSSKSEEYLKHTGVILREYNESKFGRHTCQLNEDSKVFIIHLIKSFFINVY